MKPYYRISLKRDDNTWYVINGKAVSTQTTPFYFFKKCISGWKDIGIEDQRNLRMWGFFRNYTEDSYDFVLQAATIVRSVWLTKGNNAPLILYVEKLNTTTQEYEFDYQSNINLNTSSSKRDKMSAKVLEAGIEALIKSREDTTYELDIDSNGPKYVNFLPFRVLGRAKWLTAWPNVGASNNLSLSLTGTIPPYKIYCIYVDRTLVPVSDQPNNQPISFPDPTLNNQVSGQNFEEFDAVSGLPTNNNNFLFKANIDVSNVKLTTSVNFFVENNNGGSFPGIYAGTLAKRSALGLTTLQTYSTAPIADGGQLSGTFTFNPAPFSMAAGESLILYFSFSCAPSSINSHKYAIQKDMPIKIEFEHYTDSFTVKGLPWWKVGELLINKITNGKATFSSTLFKGQTIPAKNYDLNPADLTMLSGDSIRGIAGSKLKISLSDYLKTSFITSVGGLGIEGNTVRIEHISKFLQYAAIDDGDMIADIGEVPDCEITPATDFTGYNGIQIGYPVQTYDDINGKDEFNNTSEYLLPVINDKNMYDAVSNIRADGLGIFFTWVNYALSDNKDSSSDSDLFIIQTRNAPDPVTGIYSALYPNNLVPGPIVTGVLDPNRIVNFAISPARCLRRLGPFVRSWFWEQDNDELIFQTGNKNTSLVSKITTPNPIIENANIQIGTLGNRLFLPFYQYPNTQGTNNYTQLWQGKRNGFFRFNYLGITYNGFPVKSSSKNAVPKLVDWQLLATPANNPADWVR